MTTIQEKIKKLMEEKGIKPTDLFKRGIKKATYYAIMAGTPKDISASNLWLIAQSLGTSADFLLDSSVDAPRQEDKRLTPSEEAVLLIFRAAERIGWEEAAKRVDLWEKSFVQPFEEPEEIEGLIPAKPIAKPKGLKVRDMVPAQPIDPPAKGK